MVEDIDAARRALRDLEDPVDSIWLRAISASERAWPPYARSGFIYLAELFSGKTLAKDQSQLSHCERIAETYRGVVAFHKKCKAPLFGWEGKRVQDEVKRFQDQKVCQWYGKDREGRPLVWLLPANHKGGTLGLDSIAAAYDVEIQQGIKLADEPYRPKQKVKSTANEFGGELGGFFGGKRDTTEVVVPQKTTSKFTRGRLWGKSFARDLPASQHEHRDDEYDIYPTESIDDCVDGQIVMDDTDLQPESEQEGDGDDDDDQNVSQGKQMRDGDDFLLDKYLRGQGKDGFYGQLRRADDAKEIDIKLHKGPIRRVTTKKKTVRSMSPSKRRAQHEKKEKEAETERATPIDDPKKWKNDLGALCAIPTNDPLGAEQRKKIFISAEDARTQQFGQFSVVFDRRGLSFWQSRTNGAECRSLVTKFTDETMMLMNSYYSRFGDVFILNSDIITHVALFLVAPFMEPEMARKMKLLDGPVDLLQYIEHKDIPQPWHGEIEAELKQQEDEAQKIKERANRSDRSTSYE